MFVISSTHHGRPQDFLQVWSNCGLDESPRRRKFFNSCMLLYTSFSAFLGELKLILYQQRRHAIEALEARAPPPVLRLWS